jgi:hypothetical protein
LFFLQHPDPTSTTSSPCCQTSDLDSTATVEKTWVSDDKRLSEATTYRGLWRDLHPLIEKRTTRREEEVSVVVVVAQAVSETVAPEVSD